MALTKNCSTFLFYAKKLGVSFDKTLMLGRLNLTATKEDIAADIAKFGNNAKKPEEVAFKDDYSEPLFEILGASATESMDFSDYEQATIIHDLNQPIPDDYKGKYSAIVDGGTIEHVFNFPVAIKNCMEMLKVGGHYIGITPANNAMGHGLYQFSPELYYNIFREENGFATTKMVIVTQNSAGKFSDWYEVQDPHKAKSRVLLTNSNPTYLMVIAEKKAERPIFQKPPQQSDYQAVWNISQALKENKVPQQESRLKYLYRKFTPRRLKIVAHNVYSLFTKEEIIDEDLGKINTEHFRKMEL
ncbi:MAG: hypothetical protein H7Y42_06855 [Chitinophagaceae bacterium]|nr:hypothetical protein [Chitinophagaceae bacterium]